MFVKICGFTDPANVAAVCEADARPDAIGLNLWAGSKRYVNESNGVAAANVARDCQVDSWAVTVNMPPQGLSETPGWYGVTGLQLHGDESCDRLPTARRAVPTPNGRVVRAWRVEGSLAALLAHLEPVAAEDRPDAVLLDAAVPGAYGGTGAKLDWHALRGELDRVGDRLPPVILAGGLTPENVAEAVRIVRPWGVDAAGGVESAPGVKDPAKVSAFCDAARGAL